MVMEIDMPDYARTPRIKGLLGFRQTEINWSLAMMDSKVHPIQFNGIDYWNKKQSVEALYYFYLKRIKECNAIHNSNPQEIRYMKLAECYTAKAELTKAALDKLVFDNV